MKHGSVLFILAILAEIAFLFVTYIDVSYHVKSYPSSDVLLEVEVMSCSKVQSKVSPSIYVLAASSNHLEEVKMNIWHAQQSLPPNWVIHLYNLGDLDQNVVDEISSMCRVQVKSFEITELGFPKDISWEDRWRATRGITNSLWKPIILQKAMVEVQTLGDGCGYVIWGDASIRLRNIFFENQKEYIPNRSYNLGFYGRKTAGPVANYTHPHTIDALAKLTNGYTFGTILDYRKVDEICGCFSIWRPSALGVMKNIVDPWVQCAKDIKCMAPDGSEGYQSFGYKNTNISHTCVPNYEGKCHRADQSVLSILVHHHAVHSIKIQHTNKTSTYYPDHWSHLGLNVVRNAKKNSIKLLEKSQFQFCGNNFNKTLRADGKEFLKLNIDAAASLLKDSTNMGCRNRNHVASCARALAKLIPKLPRSNKVCSIHTYITHEFLESPIIMTTLRSFLVSQSGGLNVWTDVDSFNNVTDGVNTFLNTLPVNAVSRIQVKTDPTFDFSSGERVSASDLVRFHVLGKYGGIYVDADTLFVSDLTPLCGSSFAYWWSDETYPNTAVFGSPPGGLFISKYMKYLETKKLVFTPSAYHPKRIGEFLALHNDTGLSILHSWAFDPMWLYRDNKDISIGPHWSYAVPNRSFGSFFTDAVDLSVSEKYAWRIKPIPSNPIARAFPGIFTYHVHKMRGTIRRNHQQSLYVLFVEWLDGQVIIAKKR